MTVNGFCAGNLTSITTGDAGANSIYLTELTPISNATVAAVWINVPAIGSGSATLNPSDTVAITLSNGNLTFAWASPGNGGSRTIDSQTTGKYYFEVAWATCAGSDSGVGISQAAANYTTLQAGAEHGAIAFHGFNVYLNGSSTSTNPGTMNSGTTVGVAVDLTDSLIWWTMDGTHWNSATSGTNSPATAIGGVDISSITGVPIYPVVLTAGTTDTGTCNFGATSFSYSVPSGFTAGWPSVSGFNLKAVIYDGSHSALLASSTTVTSTSLVADANRIALSSPLSVTGGTNYYVGYVCDSSLTVSIGSGGTNWWVNGGQSVSSPANPLSGGSSSTNTLLIAMEFSGATQSFGFAADYTADVTLSVEQVIASTGGAASDSARSLTYYSTATPAQAYCEITATTTAFALDYTGAVGLVAACMGLASARSNQLYCEVYSFGIGEIQGSTVNFSVSTINSGDTVSIAYDTGLDQVWFALNGGAWVGTGAGGDDPATGVAGLAVNSNGWPMMIFGAGGLDGGNPTQFILRDTANLQLYSPPSGFSAWSSGSAPVVFLAGAEGDTATDLSFGIVPPLAMGDIYVGYYPVRGIALYDAMTTSSGEVTGAQADTATSPLSTTISDATGDTIEAAPNYTPADYTAALLDLLPHGRAWPKYPQSSLYQTIAALIGTYARDPASLTGDAASAYGSSHRAGDILLDTMPAWASYGPQAVTEMLPEWNLTLGLPDPCLGDDPTVAQQVSECVARFIGSSGQSIAFFEAYAANLGFAIQITEYAPFRADYSCADRDGVCDADIWYYWQVSSLNNDEWLFETDVNTADEALGGFGNNVLECELNRIAPAHTIPVYVYYDLTEPLIGASVTASAGIMLTAVSETLTLSGASVTASTDTLIASYDCTVSLLGVAASGAVGTLVASIGLSASSSATATAGTVTTT